MLDHTFHRTAQRVDVKAPSSIQHHRLVAVVQVSRLLLEEPSLNRCQFHRAYCLFLTGHLAICTKQRTECRYRRITEEILHVQSIACLHQSGRDLQGFDRIATQLKEVILRAYGFHAQYSSPYRSQYLLHCGTRGYIGCSRIDAAFWLRQSLAVDFAVAGQRDGLQSHQARRHHVRWQPGFQRCLYLLDPQLGFSRDVSAQIFVSTLVRPVDDYGLTHTWHSLDRRFNLAQLNPVSPDFDLVVHPADKVHITVRHPPRQIACAIQTFPRYVRVRYEFLGGQVRTVQVPPCHASTANAQLTQYADRHRIQLAVHDVEACVQPRLTNRHMAAAWQLRQLFVIEAGVNRRFGDTVAVHDADICAKPFLQHPVVRHAAAIRAGDQQFHAAHVQPLFMHMLHKRYDQSWCRFEHRDLIITNPSVQTAWINAIIFRTDNHRAAVIKRPCNIADEHVEGKAGQLQQSYRELVQTVIPAIRRSRIHQAAMLNHDAFRTSGCTGRIDHICQIVWFIDRFNIRGIPGVQRLIVQCQYGMQAQPCCWFGCFFAVRLRI
ncbi:hypothetical protein D1872_86860 [compost metagenome]